MHLFIYAFIHLFIHGFVYFIYTFIYASVYLFIYAFLHAFISVIVLFWVAHCHYSLTLVSFQTCKTCFFHFNTKDILKNVHCPYSETQ